METKNFHLFYMPQEARAMSSSRLSSFPPPPSSSSHLKLMTNRVGSFGCLRVPLVSIGFFRVP